MIPLSTLVTITSESGTEVTFRFNLFRTVEITGISGPGYSSGQSLAALEDVFKQTMPKEMGFAYSGMSYQEKVAPAAGPTFVLAIVFVFLLLAALYESWRLPWAVLLGSPLVALGSFFGVWLMGYDNNVYVAVGNIMLIGLAAKNAILIVEVAKAKHEEGKSIEDIVLGSGAAALSADPHDRVCLYPRRRAVDDRERRWLRCAERHGYGRLLGHAGRYRSRGVPHSWQLRVRRGLGEKEEVGAERSPGGAVA